MFLTKPKEKARSFDETIAMLSERGAVSTGGIYVDGVNSLRQSTVYACIRVLSEITAQLPIEVQVKQGASWVTAEHHEMLDLIAEPNEFQTKHDLISFLISWAEMAGNGYLYKVKSGGKVKRLLPIEASSVDLILNPDWTIKYTVGDDQSLGDGGINGEKTAKEIFHLRNFGTNGYSGISTISNHRESVSLALQLEQHAQTAYKKGLHSTKWVELETPISDPQKLEEFKNTINSYKGSENTDSIPVMNNGKFHEFGRMSAVDAQYIESRRLQKQEIASIFGVPPFLLNDTDKSTTWGTGLEQISRAFIRFSLNPRLNRLSQTFNRELIPERERMRTRVIFDTDQFTLGEFKERMDGYKSGIEAGVINPNECRDIEGRSAREGGDKYRIPMNINIEY